jgi:hypothetical protein
VGWATEYINKLKAAETISFRPTGNSMYPLIKSGQLVTVEPANPLYFINDIVLCEVNGKEYLHLIKSIEFNMTPILYLIGNNKGGINGWTSKVYGLVTSISD